MIKKWIGVLSVVTLIGLYISGSPASAASPLTGRTIMIDPGHGGWDPGAVGPTGLREKDVNLRVANALRDCLVQYGGAQVTMTRTSDYYVSLAKRAAMANNQGVQRFISIHHNANTNRSLNGTAVYTSRNSSWASRDLSNKVQKRLVGTMGLRNIGSQTAGYYVLKNTKMPAILTEASFISNPYEEARLKNPSYVWREGFAIYQGVVDHMGK
jgi:N-acetylmuramoyl-L-alanine amidase